MILTIDGKPGSGKSTIAGELAKQLKLKHISAGDFMRQLAKEQNMSPLELSKRAEKDPSIDKEIDERTKKFGEKNNNFVMDGRITGHFIPKAIKIFLEVTPDEAANRIFKAERKDEKNDTLVSTKANMLKRLKSETERYEKYYGFNYLDTKQYDLVIDTTKLTIQQIIKKILSFLETKRI